MMSIRSLADFNGGPLGGAVTGWHRHRHRPGPTLRVDTTNEGWGLLPGHQRGPTPGHQRGLSHGHGQGHESVQPARVDALARYLTTSPQRVELVSTLHRAGPVVRATLAGTPAL